MFSAPLPVSSSESALPQACHINTQDLEDVLARGSRSSRGCHGFTDITQNSDVVAHGTVVADTVRT